MSNEQTVTRTRPKRHTKQRTQPHPFASLPPTPQQHFTLYFYAAVLNVLEQVSRAFDSHEEALSRFPFLVNYHNELARQGLDGMAMDDARAWWRDSLNAWETIVTGHLPLRALREASGLDYGALTLLMSIGLIEEDARFGALYAAMQGTSSQTRPTIGLLNGWWRDADESEIRVCLRRLQELGLVHVVNPEAPRVEWALQVPGPVWDALRGETHLLPATGLQYRPPDQLMPLQDVILPDELRSTLAMLPALLSTGEAQALIVRGPQHNGRRTILGAVARALNRGLIEIGDPRLVSDDRYRWIGSLTVLLNAMPIVVIESGPGETANMPRLNGYTGPIGLALGRQGGVSGASVERALTITLDMPDEAARREHWQRGLGAQPVDDIATIGTQFRMTSGNIYRAAHLAQSYAALNHHTAVTVADVQQASRTLNRQTLDTLATRLNTCGDWNDLAASSETLRELGNLASRCRHREQLRGAVGSTFGAQLNCGVRALFSGPSGTGKTLAARLLASVLQMDLYRLDLSSVVNKYIGETEKNLNQVFARAEELDVILLLDEGDALLTQRTSVHTSNDRYANLETNFLLQRLESFEGILIVTTNAGDRIDGAFQRRMDVVIDFAPPDAAARWAIWQLHLPPTHAVDQRLMQEVAARCTMTGGQIRNAVLHASLLALNDGGIVRDGYLEEAVHREYRKTGAVCPLRRG